MASEKTKQKPKQKIRLEEVVHTAVRHHNHLAWRENADAAGPLTAVHLVAGVLAVDHLVTAAVVGDAASVFALELSYFAQGHCREAQGRILNKKKQKNPHKQTDGRLVCQIFAY